MPTRQTSKPSSYTFSSGTRHGANMLAGWIFIDSDVSGNNITDVTGNGNTIVKDALASTEATDAIHGKCFRSDGVNGAAFDPPAAFDSMANYTAIVGVKIEQNSPAVNESVIEMDQTAAGQDAFSLTWQSTDDLFSRFESDTESNQDVEIVDAIQNKSGQYATVACVCDTANNELRVYALVDGDATQVATLAAPTFTGTPSTSDEIRLADTWTGLIEYAFILNKALTTAEVEAFHENPYAELGVVGVSATGPSSTTLGATETYSTTGLSNPITATHNGLACTVDNTAHPSVDITFPDFTDIALTDTEFGVNHDLILSDGTSQSTVQVSIQKAAGDIQTTYSASAPAGSIGANDQNLSFGDIFLVRDTAGTITTLNDDSTLLFNAANYEYSYQVWDVSLGLWSNITTNSSSDTVLPIATASASALAFVEAEIPTISSAANAIAFVDEILPIAVATANGVVFDPSDISFWQRAVPNIRLISFK